MGIAVGGGGLAGRGCLGAGQQQRPQQPHQAPVWGVPLRPRHLSDPCKFILNFLISKSWSEFFTVIYLNSILIVSLFLRNRKRDSANNNKIHFASQFFRNNLPPQGVWFTVGKHELYSHQSNEFKIRKTDTRS